MNDITIWTPEGQAVKRVGLVYSNDTAHSLRIFEDARREIADAGSADQVKRILALATGLAAAARKATDREMEAEAEVLKFEAERRLGQLMQAQRETVGLNVGTRGSRTKGARVSEKPTLAEVVPELSDLRWLATSPDLAESPAISRAGSLDCPKFTHCRDSRAREGEVIVSGSLELLVSAGKASARPSFCQWNYFGSACRVS